MALPPALRQAVETVLEGVRPAELARASATLSARYRAELQDGAWHLLSDEAARAYLAARLPATYAATAASLEQLAYARPDFHPKTLLDVGAGPGTVVWAVTARWPELGAAHLLEASPVIRRYGEQLGVALPLEPLWQTADIVQGVPAAEPADLVTLAYVLDELTLGARTRLVGDLWALTKDVLLIVEPGTPAGYQRLLAARDQLLGAGAHILAPCPHAEACPLAKPDWCHFSVRVARSRTHLQTKAAEVGWEDEKYSYLAVARVPGARFVGRVLATPRARPGLVTLKLCQATGEAAERVLSKRDGDAYKRARRLGWGDTFS